MCPQNTSVPSAFELSTHCCVVNICQKQSLWCHQGRLTLTPLKTLTERLVRVWLQHKTTAQPHTNWCSLKKKCMWMFCLTLRVLTTCCRSSEGWHTPLQLFLGQVGIVKSALFASTEVLKVVRTAAAKTGCLCVSSRDRCAKQITSESHWAVKGI